MPDVEPGVVGVPVPVPLSSNGFDPPPQDASHNGISNVAVMRFMMRLPSICSIIVVFCVKPMGLNLKANLSSTGSGKKRCLVAVAHIPHIAVPHRPSPRYSKTRIALVTKEPFMPRTPPNVSLITGRCPGAESAIVRSASAPHRPAHPENPTCANT